MEPPVRQRYLALFTLFASLPAGALTFQTRMENIAWTVEGDQFECRLISRSTVSAVGVRAPGRRAAVFQLRSQQCAGRRFRHLLAAAAPWQPGRGDINLGSVRMARNGVLFSSSQGQASRLINGLARWAQHGGAQLRRRRPAGMEVRVLPVSFAKAYSDYQPVRQAAADELRSGSPDPGRLPGRHRSGCSARARLDVILDYMKADPTVNHIELDGHSDNSGNRLTNRDAVAPSRAGGGRLLQGPWHRRRTDHRALPWRALSAGEEQQRRQPGATVGSTSSSIG
jgi:hypothetical protein